MFLGDAIDFDLFALAAGDEKQQRHQDGKPFHGLRERTLRSGRVFKRITLHNVIN